MWRRKGESLKNRKESVGDYGIDYKLFVTRYLSDEVLAKEYETDEDNWPAAEKACLQIIQKICRRNEKENGKIRPRFRL